MRKTQIIELAKKIAEKFGSRRAASYLRSIGYSIELAFMVLFPSLKISKPG